MGDLPSDAQRKLLGSADPTGRLPAYPEPPRHTVRACRRRRWIEQRLFREVPVTEKSDHYRGTVDVVRLDTGEVIESRAMTPEERKHPQLSLVGA